MPFSSLDPHFKGFTVTKQLALATHLPFPTPPLGPYDRGAKRTYVLTDLQDLDMISEVHLQHRPSAMAMSRDWSPQHVEVCNEGTGKTFFFLAGV